MTKWLAVSLLTFIFISAKADIQAPPRPGPTYKFGLGMAKTGLSAVYILDSIYDRVQYDSLTSAHTVGVAEGVSKTIFSTGYGIAEMATFYLKPYRPINPRYGMPPADLKNNFY